MKYPEVLIALGQAGESGLPVIRNPEFERELQLCREWGFGLRSDADRVSLCFDQDQLVPGWIQNETPALAWDRLDIKGFLRLGSTNAEALDLARQGCPSGTLIIAEEQTQGKGRMSRRWVSPPGAGLYATLILRPKQHTQYWPLLTLAASVALVDALKDLAGRGVMPAPLDIDIKWPNDVLIARKKCAGILLETLMSDERNPAAVLGFGINVRKQGVPETLAPDAVSLEEAGHQQVPRRLVLSRFLYFFQLCYLAFEQGKHKEVLERWKSASSMWNGVPVWVGEGKMRRRAVTCGLSDIGALRVQAAEGTVETLFAETVRIAENS